MRTAFVLALVHVANAKQAPVLNFKVKKGTVGKPSLESVTGNCLWNWDATDKVTVGGSLGLGVFSADAVRDLFVKVSGDLIGRKVVTSTTYNFADQSIAGTVDISGTGPSIKAKLSSNAANVVESVALTTKGKGWRITPTLHVQDLEVDLDAETSLAEGTEARFNLKHSGSASVDVFHKLDSSTRVKVSATSQLKELEVSLARDLGASDTIVPRYNVPKRSASIEWTHKLGAGGAAVTTSASQATKRVKVQLVGDSDSDWTAEVSAPWASPLDADLSIGRKFSVSALSDLKLPFGF